MTGGAIALGNGGISGSDGDAFRVGDGAGTAGTGGTSAITYAGSISKTDGAGQAVDIQDRAAGAGNITLSGNITHNVASQTGILLDDNVAGTITFSGSSKSITSTTATAVNLTDNAGATIAFTNGGLVINTTAGNGFNATGAGRRRDHRRDGHGRGERQHDCIDDRHRAECRQHHDRREPT